MTKRGFHRLLQTLTAISVLAAFSVSVWKDRHKEEAAPTPAAASAVPAADNKTGYMDPALPVDERVRLLLSQMTLDEKIGQMVQADRASTTPDDMKQYFLGALLSGGGGAPTSNTPKAWMDTYDRYQEQALATRLQIPYLYGIDAVHGHNNAHGAVIFPHNIGLGATRDTELMTRIGAVVAKEVSATGIDWTFAPTLAVPLNERWGRTYEGFSEEPEIVAQMGEAMVKGLQGELGSPDYLRGDHILATLKHWVGDGATTDGIDRGNVEMSEEQLERYMEPYKLAIAAGAKTVMVSYSGWNGTETHGDRYLITDKLKGQLGFQGFVVSDFDGINQISPDYEKAVLTGVNAGIDMFMMTTTWKEFIALTKKLVGQGDIPQSRIDDAVSRILRVKLEAGLFEQPFADRAYLEQQSFGSAEHRAVAREAVRKSLVLLKNENGVLPLAKSGQKLFVAGKKANDIGLQSGGWTISWQGSAGPITPGTTILEGIQAAVSDPASVTYDAGGKGAQGHDAAIVVVGEEPYAEINGDREDLSLSPEDVKLLETVRASGVPMVVILISGRPMIVTEQLPQWQALVAAWLPGTEGAGVADALFGSYPFTGKLPYTWPKSMQQIPIQVGDAGYDPLFPYGYGLTAER